MQKSLDNRIGAVPSSGSVTKFEHAYSVLRERILHGTLPPNQAIQPQFVSVELGMSIIPVREALRRLEQEGLVIIKPHVGATVREFPVEEACENLLIRAELETLATRLATPRVTPDLLRVLASILDEMDNNQQAANWDEFGSLNKRFHLTIYSVLQERQLLRLIQSLWDQIPRSGSVLVIVPEHAPITQAEHRALLDALSRGDAETAARLTREHKLLSLQVLKSAWEGARSVDLTGGESRTVLSYASPAE
jgi:DNA-binding GntR family transcriptional regulator